MSELAVDRLAARQRTRLANCKLSAEATFRVDCIMRKPTKTTIHRSQFSAVLDGERPLDASEKLHPKRELVKAIETLLARSQQLLICTSRECRSNSVGLPLLLHWEKFS